MLDLEEKAHSGSVSPVLKALPANVLHHGTDASRCAGSITVGPALESLCLPACADPILAFGWECNGREGWGEG